MDLSPNALRKSRRNGTAQAAVLPMVLLALVAGAALVGLAFYAGLIKVPGSTVGTGNGNGNTGIPVGSLVQTTLPMAFTNTDPFASAAPISTTATFTIYNGQGVAVTSCATVSTTGQCTASGFSALSGNSYIAKISTSTYVTEFIPFSVPWVPQGYTGTTIPVQMYQIKTASFVTTFNIGTTTVTTGITKTFNTYKYNFTSTAVQPVTVNLAYKVANTGYLGCNSGTGQQYDVVARLCQNAVLQISDTGTGLALGGMPQTISSGSSRYWWTVLPDGVFVSQPSNGGMGFTTVIGAPGTQSTYASNGNQPATPLGSLSGAPNTNTQGGLSEQTIGANLYGGRVTATFTIQQGSVVSGSTENLVVTAYFYADANYFQANNNLGPNKANATTPFTLIFKAF